jgi:hypothetical protein
MAQPLRHSWGAGLVNDRAATVRRLAIDGNLLAHVAQHGIAERARFLDPAAITAGGRLSASIVARRSIGPMPPQELASLHLW